MTDLSRVFDLYHKRYEEILKRFYPSKNGTGFQERNQTVNFAHAYEEEAKRLGEDCVVWYEFQFGKNNRRHLDALIVNKSSKEIIFIEAKRFTSLSKVDSVRHDINRINGKHGVEDEPGILAELLSEDNSHGARIPGFEKYKRYTGLILADVWAYNDDKKAILASFQEKNFLSKYSDYVAIDIEDKNLAYYEKDFDIKTEQCKWIDEEYWLLGFSWDINK